MFAYLRGREGLQNPLEQHPQVALIVRIVQEVEVGLDEGWLLRVFFHPGFVYLRRFGTRSQWMSECTSQGNGSESITGSVQTKLLHAGLTYIR